jgi:cobalt/nickel transport system ATP-binding protein
VARRNRGIARRNGSGKTTFVLHLNGLLAGEGEVRVCGVPVEKKTLADVRRRVGLLFQDPDEQLFMPTVIEDVAFGPLNLGLNTEQAEKRAREALSQVGASAAAGRAPYHLSAGEKRRVALAGVLAMEPEILVAGRAHHVPGSSGSTRPGCCCMACASQDPGHARHSVRRRSRHRAVFFERGRIVAEGAVREIVEKSPGPRVPALSRQGDDDLQAGISVSARMHPFVQPDGPLCG